jgi:hypothetical protein
MNNSILSLIIFLDFSHELLISNLNYMIKLIVQREVNDIIMRINIYSKVFKGCTHVLMVVDKISKMCPMRITQLIGILHIICRTEVRTLLLSLIISKDKNYSH